VSQNPSALLGQNSLAEPARMLIDAESWRHFLESPVWGYGWYSSEVARWLRVPLGSHSTIYGTLYTGGLVTFSVVAAAYLAMVYLSWRCLRIAGGAGLAAASIVAAFGVMSYSENVTAFAPSLMSVFVFLGGVFGTSIPGPAPIIAAPATAPDPLPRRRAY
jgi:O-antigen ligase